MRYGKKVLVIAAAVTLVFVGMAASEPPAGQFKNLKVLPRKISHETMDKVMEEFAKSLGVGCDFCHVKPASDSAVWDMANDAKPEKSVARHMIKMSNKINKGFFKGKTKYGEENAVLAIRCVTCHHGQPHPEIDEQKHEEKSNQ